MGSGAVGADRQELGSGGSVVWGVRAGRAQPRGFRVSAEISGSRTAPHPIVSKVVAALYGFLLAPFLRSFGRWTWEVVLGKVKGPLVTLVLRPLGCLDIYS